MKKTVLGLGIVLSIAFMYYFLYSPKYKEVSQEKPFSEILNKKLTTKRYAVILKHPEHSIHEQYNYHFEDGNSYGMDSGLEIIADIPIGTEVVLDKAELHTGRVSGTTTAYVFGTIYSKEKKKRYDFQYPWGDYHLLFEDTPFWTFKLAFWQDKPLTQKYFIKVP
ncbi:hypothetical protein [uncultured Formosa sp.]|uniref:hypothetical protein n=1 Tax=uncultured Formosa sp. TaxID=255435 RepID=UPI00261461F8|nr:hypothetical protein [uncultured Formosa sp.]